MSNGDRSSRSRQAERERAALFLQRFHEQVWPSPLTVRRFESPLARTAGVAADWPIVGQGRFADLPIVGHTLPALGFSLGHVLDLPQNFLEGATNTLLKELGIGVTEEEIAGITVEGSRVRDVTDTRLPLSQLAERGIELTEDERRQRNFRRFLSSGFHAAANLGTGGLHRAYQEGALAPPEDEREQVADLAGQLLADMGVTIPFVPGFSMGARAGVRLLARTPGTTQIGARLSSAIAKRYGADVATRVLEETGRVFTNLGIDAEVGMALGGLHMLHAVQNGEDMSPGEIVRNIGYFTAAGLVLGGALHGVPTAVHTGRSLSRWQNMILHGPWRGAQIGMRVETPAGTLELVGKGLPNRAGHRPASWYNQTTKRFAKAPTPEEIATWVRGRVEHQQRVTSLAQEIQEVPPVLPNLEERASTIQASAAGWATRMEARAGQVSPEVLRMEMRSLVEQATDVGLPHATRASLLGRARAIEYALGELQPLPGAVPLEIERAALEVVTGTPRAEATRIAAEYLASGQQALGTRITTLLSEGIPDLHVRSVERAVERGQLAANRGLRRNDIVRTTDDRTLRLLEDPSFGVVRARQVSPKPEGRALPEVVELADVTIRPKAGRTARLSDGRVVEILEATGGDVRQVKVRFADGTEETFAFAAVRELGSNPRVARLHRWEMLRARQPNRQGAQGVIPAVAATVEGEVGTVVAQGPKGTVLRTAEGTERVVERAYPTKDSPDVPEVLGGTVEELAAREAVTAEAGAAEFREIVMAQAVREAERLGEAGQAGAAAEALREAIGYVERPRVRLFAPRTRPDPDHHILFLAVPRETASAFERAVQSGADLTPHLSGGIHVLPPTTAGRGVTLYGVELPRTVLPSRAYSRGANRARSALRGKSVGLTSYESRVEVPPEAVARARIYRVPEGLHAKAQVPEDVLATLQGEERAAYLRRLLDFGDDVDSPTTKAAGRRRAAQEKRARAILERDGAAAGRATVEEAQAIVDVAEATVDRAVQNAERSAARVRQTVTMQDVEANTVLRRAYLGDAQALQATVGQALDAGREITFLHQEVPGRTFTLREQEGALDGWLREGLAGQHLTFEGNRAQVLAKLDEIGFRGGTHRYDPPGTYVLDGHPYVRAEVGEGGVRLYRGERLAGSGDVVWALDAVGRELPEGFVREVTGALEAREATVVRGLRQEPSKTPAPAREPVFEREITDLEEIVRLPDGTLGVRTTAPPTGLADPRIREVAGSVGDIAPPWEIGPASVLVEGNPQPLFGGTLARRATSGNVSFLREAADAVARRVDRQTWAPIVNETVNASPADTPSTLDAFGRYEPTGQPVRIVAAELDGQTVTVEFPDGGVREVARSEVQPSRIRDRNVQDYRIALEAFNGDLAFAHEATPPLGYGAIERELGLFGTDRASVVRDRAVTRARTDLGRLAFRDGEVLGPPDAVERLVSLYDRSIDLGFADDILREIPEEARPAFREAAYVHTRQRFADEPYGLLYAGAKYDKLVPKQLEVLRVFARESRLDPALPPHRIAEELWNRRLIDPMVAQWTLDYRTELGAVRTASDVAYDPSAIELRRRPSRGNRWYRVGAQWANPSHYEMLRHPTMQAAEASVRAAYQHLQSDHAGLANWMTVWQRQRRFTFPDGTTRRITAKDTEFVRDLIERHGTWDAAVRAKAVQAGDPRRAYFEETIEKLDGLLDRLKRVHLRMRTEPLRFRELPEAIKAEFLERHPGLADRMLDDYYLMPNQMSRFNPEGGLRTRRRNVSDEDIDAFLGLLRQHETSEALPPEVTGWMREEFDLWKRWGRRNYWPRLHEGEFSVEIRKADGWHPVGFTESFHEGVDLYRVLRERGEFGSEPYRVVHRRAYGDDILQETMSQKELFTWASALRETVIAEEDDLAALLIPAGRPPPRPPAGRVPVTGPLAERLEVATLRPPRRPPWEEMKLLERKVARLEYREQVASAYRRFLDQNNKQARRLDRALADVEGIAPLFSDENRALRTYAENWFEDAIGVPSWSERQASRAYAYWQMLQHGPTIAARTGMQKLWAQWLNGEDVTLPPGLFDVENWQSYGGLRQRVNELIAFQAQWRMAMNPATAFVNATQYHVYTVPLLRREYGVRAAWHARGSWLTAVRLWRAQQRGRPLTGRLALLNRVADETGANVQAGRHVAGASSAAATIESSMSRPITLGMGMSGKTRAWADFVGMYMFNGAERVNRLATAIAGYEAGVLPKARGGLGLTHEASVAKARELIGNTQFWYDELNLPLAMRRGPLGGAAARVLLQFKPFMVNALRYEVDMATQAAKGLARGDLTPALAAANHAALYAVYGGATGLIKHPILAGTLWATGMLPFLPKPREIQARLVERFGEKPEDYPGRPEGLEAMGETLLLHGVPGLLNLSLGSRIGITGQELASLGTTNWWGPHFSTAADFTQAVIGFARQRGTGAETAALAAAFLAPQFIPGAGGRGLVATPYTRLLASYAAAFGPGMEQWKEWLQQSPEGQRFLNRLMPSFVRNGHRAFQLYQQGFYTDTRGRQIEVPYGEEGTEALIKAGGFPSRRDEERQAYLNWLRPEAFSYEATHNQLARAAADAWVRGDLERMWEIILEAREQQIFLEAASIERQIERANEDQVEGFIQQLPLVLRRERP